MDISIIVPVFNAERYLRRCLDSIMVSCKWASSNLEEIASPVQGSFEILLIDNDSSDNSLAIMREYAKKYPKVVTVLDCHTPGAAAVRNLGVKKAKGKYIWFIDADDTIRKDAVLELMRKAEETEADLVMMGAERIYTNGHKDYLSPVSPEEPEYKSRFVRYGMGPWQVLIRREWWVKHHFAFHEGIIHEDMELMSALILDTDKLAAIDLPLYRYEQNDESVLHKKEFSPHIFDIFPALQGLYARFEKAGATEEYHDELEWFFIWNLLIDSAKDFGQFPEGYPGFQRSREMLTEYFPGWRKNRFLRAKPLRLNALVRLNYKK